MTTTTIVQTLVDENNRIRLQGKSLLDSSSTLVNLTTIGQLHAVKPSSCALTRAHSTRRLSELHQSIGSHTFDGSNHLAAGSEQLDSLVSDFAASLRAAADVMNIDLEGGTISCSGKLDFSGTLGATDERGNAIPVQFKSITLSLRLECWEEDKGQIPELIKMAEQSCTLLGDTRQYAEVQVRIGHLGRVGPDCVRDEHADVTFNHMGNGMHRVQSLSTMIAV